MVDAKGYAVTSLRVETGPAMASGITRDRCDHWNPAPRKDFH